MSGGDDDEITLMLGPTTRELLRSPLASLTPLALDLAPFDPQVAASFAPAGITRKRWATVISLTATACTLLFLAGRTFASLGGPAFSDAATRPSVSTPLLEHLGRPVAEPWVPVVVEDSPAPREIAAFGAQKRKALHGSSAKRNTSAFIAPLFMVPLAADAAQPPERESDTVEPEASPSEIEPAAIASFDRTAAATSLAEVSALAASCRTGEADHGVTRAAITFAESGRVTTAVLEPGSIFGGHPIAGCIVARLREARVPPFQGEKVTVHTTVTVE